MALALRLFLLLLLAVALPARAAQAAPWPARGAGLPTVHTHDTGNEKSMEADRLLDQMLSDLEISRDEHEVSQVARLHEDLQPLEPPAVTDVSAGKAFPNPLADATQEPSSNPRGSLRRKKKPIGNSEIQDDSNLLDQMLSDLEISREIEEETGLAAPIPRGSSGSVPVSAAGREAMPGTVTGGPPGWNNPEIGDKKSLEADRLLEQMLSDLEISRDERAWKVSQVARLHEDLQPLEPPAVTGVSAGKAFPNPLADATQEPSSNPRGSLRRKKKPIGNSEIQDDSNLLDQMLSDLEISRAMKGKTVLTALFARGSSGSVPASAAGREAMPGTVTGDEHEVSQVARLHEDLQPLEPPAVTDVSAGKAFPNPLADATQEPSSNPRGSLRRKKKPIGNSEIQDDSNLLDQMLSDLEISREIEEETGLVAPIPRGSSGSVPVSAAGREAMPGTVTGGPPGWNNPDIGDKKSLEADRLLDKMLSDLERRRDELVGEGDLASQPTFREVPLGAGEVIEQKSVPKEAFPRGSSGSVQASPAGGTVTPGTGTGTGTEDAVGTAAHVPNFQKEDGKAFCQDTRCRLKLIAFLVLLDLVFILCCIVIWYHWKRKRSAPAASRDRTRHQMETPFPVIGHPQPSLLWPCYSCLTSL
ncbi:uncharacterized protein LOC130258241 isoform X2 [Oenanthe melanoleuca]|uniref:uncharacterized protein LOC130258241 isoform X2 n=1 Tax=Oenanthe melanoleuca TaxID=2939378 RepID=UPI0024C0E969|nr:uncharacterized protein LOC130258241 isoform X2 [Oenanthe melanoleuca]